MKEWERNKRIKPRPSIISWGGLLDAHGTFTLSESLVEVVYFGNA